VSNNKISFKAVPGSMAKQPVVGDTSNGKSAQPVKDPLFVVMDPVTVTSVATDSSFSSSVPLTIIPPRTVSLTDSIFETTA
jgi:hypothetical protein